MGFEYYAEGPLLQIVLVLFGLGIVTRFTFFATAIIRSSRGRNTKGIYIPLMLIRVFAPFHRAIIKRPLYAFLRYVFHICLFVIPIWYSRHIDLWYESRLELEWGPISDDLADWMTLALLVLAGYFFIRRILIKEIRTSSSIYDYLLILVVGLAFGSGYALSHGSLDSISFFYENLYLIHVISGEVMILVMILLFCRTWINEKNCTGCASCELNCPTGTIASNDQSGTRIFSYGHYQCICCGTCVYVCPDEAAELRHEISLKSFFRIWKKKEIRTVELSLCECCGNPFAPEPQIDKIGQTISDDFLVHCPKCKKNNAAAVFTHSFAAGRIDYKLFQNLRSHFRHLF